MAKQKKSVKVGQQKLSRPANKWSTRKLVGFIVLFLSSLLLCFTSKSTGAETYQFWIWLFGLYIVGNVGTKIIVLNERTKKKK